MIIKSGAYRFNDELTDFKFSSVLPFSCDGVNYNLFAVAYTDTDPFVSLTYVLMNDDYTDILHDVTVYRKPNNEYWLDEKYRYITILNDTDVDEESFNSFASNTTMLIKSGKYKWNDMLTKPNNIGLGFESTIDFNTPLITDEDMVIGSWNYMGLINYPEGHMLAYVSFATGLELPAWEAQNGWNTGNIESEGFLPQGYGQEIYIIFDTYVPTEFGLWATSNWQPYVEPTPTEDVTITLTYKGTPFLTITNGEITTPTTSATSVEIPTKDYSFTENIKIEITKS